MPHSEAFIRGPIRGPIRGLGPRSWGLVGRWSRIALGWCLLATVLQAEVRTGADALLAADPSPLRGRRVGLVTNPTGVTRDLESLALRLRQRKDFELVALYGPEHGVRGNAQAGDKVGFQWDPVLGLPLFSLYGKTFKPTGPMLTNIAGMVRGSPGIPTNAVLAERIDAMVFDIQDVGSRAYTYVGTLSKVMEACAEHGVPIWVLDRPNPLGGVVMEGPVLEAPEWVSLVGIQPIPMRHGMTVGELARLFNARFLARPAALTVLPLTGWSRSLEFAQTGLPWVMPSPNMPTLDTARVYPGQVLLEGTNLSEGRGTTRPFELFGAPWIQGRELTDALNALRLPGVVFREAWFTPSFSKHRGELCGGSQIHVTDAARFRSVTTTLRLLQTVRRLYPDRLTFQGPTFDRLMGTATVRPLLESGADLAPALARIEGDLKAFDALRQPHLLYP
jgi:uncharacterized protein YbbC (DUF1343 family)